MVATSGPRQGERAKTRTIPLLAAAVLVLACGDDQMPPIACGGIPQQTVTVDEEAVVEPCFEDPEMGELTLAAASSDPGVANTEVAGAAGDKVRITGVSPGTATITVTATDPDMLAAELAFEVLVPNRAPEVTGEIPDRTLPPGNTVTLDVSGNFSDPDGDALAFTAESGDTTVAAVSAEGSVVTIAASGVGSATVTVTATDPGGLSASDAFEVLVPNRAPVAVGEIPDIGLEEGDTVVSPVGQFFSDPDGDPLTYEAVSSDEAVLTVSMDADILTAGAAGAGEAAATITATDPGGLSATQTARVTVAAANRAPEVTEPIPDQTLAPGGALALNVATNFTDPDGDDLAFAATSGDTGVATVSVDGPVVAIVATGAGSASITVTATDPGGLSATQTFGLTVTAGNRGPVAVGEIPDIGLEEGDTVVSLVSQYFSDPDGDPLTYEAVSSDTTVVTVSMAGDVLTAVAVGLGEEAVTITATDPGGLSATQTRNVTVTAGNRAPEVIEAIPDQTLAPGDSLALDVSGNFTDPDGDDLAFTAESGDIGVAAVSVGGSVVTVVAVGVGSASVTVTATDPGGLSASQTFVVSTTGNQPPFVVRQHKPIIGIEHWQSTGTDVKRFFSDPDGDPLAYGIASSDTAVARVSMTSPTFYWMNLASMGVATVTLTATDPGGLRAKTAFTVKVVSRKMPFRDDFESDESMDGWDLAADAVPEFGEGVMHVTHPGDKTWGGLRRPVVANRWSVTARMGNATEGGWAQLIVWAFRSTTRPVRAFALQVGPDPGNHWTDDDTNWRLLKLNVGGGEWSVVASGESEAVGGAGQLVDVELSHRIGLEVSIGGVEEYRSFDFGFGFQYHVDQVTLGVWPVPGTTETKTGVFDWVVVDGVFGWPDPDTGVRSGGDPAPPSYRDPAKRGQARRGRRRFRRRTTGIRSRHSVFGKD